jgi:hypothetical protein
LLVAVVTFVVVVVAQSANAAQWTNDVGGAINPRPIVGVMAQPTYADPQYKGLGRTYLAAAYVKWFGPPPQHAATTTNCSGAVTVRAGSKAQALVS